MKAGYLFPDLEEVQLDGAWRVIHLLQRRDIDAVSPTANVEKDKSPTNTTSYLSSVWECSECRIASDAYGSGTESCLKSRC